MSKQIAVSIIIVSDNHSSYLDQCLQSVFKQQNKIRTEIFLVDNASTDNTLKLIKMNFPQIKIISQKYKQGFAKNNNMAIQQSKGKYALLLNPDTEVKHGALRQMIRFMDTHPKVGICGPQLRFPDGRLQYSCRRFPTWKSFLVRRTPLRWILKNSQINKHHLMVDMDHHKVQEVDWLLGACMLIRQEVFEEIGLFDEHFFMYVEDIDFCLRAHRKGWKVYYVPQSTVIHHHAASSDKYFFSKYFLFHLLSMLYFTTKYKISLASLDKDKL